MQKAQRVYKYLKSQGKTIATAESCTGGMIGSSLTAIAGVSEVYGYGFVTYSNEAKMQLLGVNEHTLACFGAVSAETVSEMAEGALSRS
ncbi:MAG: nicotinamide-nucleotide amidohydrolase family protein, partial [Clostridia bacterium]|nr:nicotinamide-nucleotide amidohydrolase family protein [Clostridia bacterium]